MPEGRESADPERVPAALTVPPWDLGEIAQINAAAALISNLAKKHADLKVNVSDAVTVRENLSISDPLQARWIAGRLPVEEISKIRALAGAVFEDQAVGEAWLEEPNLATYNKAPIELLGTPGGFESVKNLLMRIEHGILA